MLERASFPRRLLALLVDWVVALFTAALFFPLGSNEFIPSTARLLFFVIEVGTLTSLTGASIGQRILGVRVVSWPEQFFLTPKYAFIRTLLIALVIPPVIIGSDGRGLHERLTNSAVVRLSRLGRP